MKKTFFRFLNCLLIFVMALGFCGCRRVPVYTSNASIYVESAENNTANPVELTTAEMAVDAYIEILSSNIFCALIKEKLNLSYSTSEIKSMITYSRVEETRVVHISVTAPSAKDAYEICNAILLYANEQIEDVMRVGSVRTIDSATMPSGPSSYNYTK